MEEKEMKRWACSNTEFCPSDGAGMERCYSPSIPDWLQMHHYATAEELYHDVAHSTQIRQISEQYHETLWQGFDVEPDLNSLPYVHPTKPYFDEENMFFPSQWVFVGMRCWSEQWDRPTAARWRDELFTGLGAHLAYLGPTGRMVLLVLLCRTDESYWSGNFHEQLDLFQESCRKAMERRSRLLKQMDGHPVYLKWERFLPLFHDSDAKYVGNPLWG
jgi:hypothetical protein